MGFLDWKKKAMRKYRKAKKEKLVDGDIKDYLNDFNKLDNYYTTSSCSGRILLLKTAEDNKKMPNAFYYKTHSEAKPEVIIRRVKAYKQDLELWFKLEPYILHVGCRDLKSARKLLALCKKHGIKRAGINAWSKRIIVEIIGTQYIDSLVVKDKKVVVSDEYLKLITVKANQRLKQAKEVLYDFFKKARVTLSTF